MIRRTFLKMCAGVTLAVAGCFPSLMSGRVRHPREIHKGLWQIVVPRCGTRGSVVEPGYSFYDQAVERAKAFASGGPWYVFPQEGRGMSNGVPAHEVPGLLEKVGLA